MEETKPEEKKEFVTPSYSGLWMSENLYIECGLVRDGTFIRLRDKSRNILCEFLYEDFNKRVKMLRATAQKLSKM